MAPSTSSGKMSNKETVPHEIRGRMTWDPEFRKQYQHQYSTLEDEGSDDDDDSDYEYPTVPYVSGGTQPVRHANGPSLTLENTSGNAQANEAASNSMPQNDARSDGFRRVSYKRPTKNTNYGNAKQPQEPRVPRRLNLNSNKDNFAKACFRKRDKHNGEFVLPKDCDEIEPDKAKMYDFLEELGVRLGSFIRSPQHSKDRTLLLWGKTEAIEKTIQALREWLRPSKPTGAIAPGPTRPRAGEKFGKSRSTIGDLYKREQDAIKKKADLQRFQQVPAKDQHFDCPTGIFLWPVEEVRPQDILGDSLEALDPVRMAYKCHIIFDDQLSAFKILTNNKGSVEQTLPRIEGIMKEYVARTHRPITRYYIEPPGPSIHRKDIKIVPSQSSGSVAGAPQIPTLTGKALEPEARANWLKLSANLVAQSNRGFEDALRKTIPNLMFYRGQVRMRVQFGTFGLTVFRWPGTATSLPFEDFMKNLATPGTKGTMIRDLCIKKDASTILGRIYNANELLQPIDNQVMTLAEVTPSFTAYFECQEHDKGPLKLEVEMNGNVAAKDLYEKTHALWSKLGRRDNTTPLDMFMIRLDGGPSWKLRASTENPIDPTRISPKMVQFMQSVKSTKKPKTSIELSGDRVFDWDKTPGCMLVTAFQQKTSLRFRLVKNMDYILEISRYETYGERGDENKSTHTNWGASLWNTEWDAELMANGTLGIGESANWDPSLRTFFPAQSSVVSASQEVDAGVIDFLEIVGEVNEFLNDIKGEPPPLSD